jgi:enoyl-[acyl-carrier protein] reductase II
MNKNHSPQHFCRILNINYPIIQAGMVWVSGAKLAAASAEAGILGTLGAGSMSLEVLEGQLQKLNQLTRRSVAVNIPLLYEKNLEQIELCLKYGIKIFITSAGSPKLFTGKIKAAGGLVMHVVSSPVLAKKCQEVGVDIVIAEGFEAGGHNGRDEITTLGLIPQVVDNVSIPVVAAGGIVDGRGIAAALALGASGVQMGTRFMLSQESAAHSKTKELLLKAEANSTHLALKKHIPVRLFKNAFALKALELEQKGASREELEQFLGKGRARRGIFEGDLEQGEIEVGQAVSLIDDILPVKNIVDQIIIQYEKTVQTLPKSIKYI